MQEGTYNVGDYVEDDNTSFAEDSSPDYSDDQDVVQEEPEEEVEQSYEEEAEQPEPEPKKELAPPKKKTRIGDRLSQVQRERYEALEEAQRLRAENDRLRSLANMSTQTALEHYDKSVVQKVHTAKENKIKALENGDIHAQAEADVALALATAEYQNLANMKAQHNYQQPSYEQQQQPAPAQTMVDQRLVEDWAATNDWFDQRSENYDDELAEHVEHYCDVLDNNLYRTGRQHEIMSPQYFEAVDYYVNQLKGQREQQKRGGDLNMKPSRGTVSPVRGGGVQRASSNSGQSKVGLTRDEMEMARLYKVKPEVYLQYKLKDMKEGRESRGRR